MHYRRTPTSSGYSPSELLNSRQMRTIVDTLLPSPLHMAQSKVKKPNKTISKLSHQFQVGDAFYALYFGSRRDQDPRWVLAIIVKRQGTRMFNVRVVPRGPIWTRHLDQLQPRNTSDEDDDPSEAPSFQDSQADTASDTSSNEEHTIQPSPPDEPGSTVSPPLYTPQHPRRSTRRRRLSDFYVSHW